MNSQCTHDVTYPASNGMAKCAMCHKVMVNLEIPTIDENDPYAERHEIERLEQQLSVITADRNACEHEINRLKSYFVRIQELLCPVLLDQEGYVSIHGSDADKEYIQKAIEIINREAK